MLRKCLLCFGICYSFASSITAQSLTNEDWIMDNVFLEDDVEEDWASWVEEMEELKANPLDVNALTKEQLEQFPFLSDRIIENILYYVYKHGPLVSLKELAMVQDMDYRVLKLLTPFLYIGKGNDKKDVLSWKSVLKYNKQELSTRVDIPMYVRAGYASYTDEVLTESPNKRYLGTPLYHNLRYSFRYKDKVYAGITMEKDAGEQWFGKYNKKGADFYSPYLLIKDLGRIRTLALGNYRASFGYGLVLNTGFSLGKTITASQSNRQGFSKHSSCDEYNFFQGAGISYQVSKRWLISALYSYRNMDGIVDNSFIISIKKDGYHRLIRDFEKHKTFNNQVIGTNVNYNGKQYEFGVTAVYNVFNKILNPDFREYNKYYPRGKSFYNIGANYKVFLKKAVIGGEVAVDKCGKIAWINRIDYRFINNWNLLFINRYYDKSYQSIYGKSISESSMLQNEYGVFIGLETSFLKNIILANYTDIFYFPYQKYGISASGTSGIENTFQLTYSPFHSLSLFIKYRYKNKAEDMRDSEENKITAPGNQHKLNVYLSYQPSPKIKLKTAVYGNQKKTWNQPVYRGFLINQQVSIAPLKLPCQLDLSAAWFQTDNYDTRITMYEKSVLYAFSMPSFYGKGTRFALNVRYSFRNWLVLQAKYGLTYYFDRDKISSGTEEIQDCKKGDIYLQLRIKW